MRLVALAVVSAALACGGNGATVTASGKVPAYPTDFTPSPALGAPPPADPTARGYGYLDEAYDGIRAAWTQFLEDCRLRLPPAHPLNRSSLEATVELEIDAHGGVLELAIKGSGNDEYDAAVTGVVRDREPFPNPPEELLSDDGRLHVTWRFARDVRQAGLAGASVSVIQWSAERAVPKLLGEGRIGEAARRLAREPADDPHKADLAEAVFSAAITEAIDGRDLAARRLAVETAARTPIPAASPALRGHARSSVDPVVRAATFTALATLAEPETPALALAALAEGPTAGSPVIVAAASALDRVGAADKMKPTIAEWLRTAGRGNPSALTASLAALSAVPAGDLLPQVIERVTGADARVRAAACPVYGTAAIAGAALAWTALIDGIKDADATVRAACATAAGSAGAGGGKDRKTVAALAGQLADRDLTARAATVVALARLDAARAATELRRLAKETSPVVLAALVEAWSRLAKPPKDRVRKLARHPDPAVRAAAIAALVRLGDKTSLDEAALHAGDAAEAVRLAALPAITAETVLRELARDSSPAVRAAVDERLVEVLGRSATTNERLTAFADAEPASLARVRIAASWLLAR